MPQPYLPHFQDSRYDVGVGSLHDRPKLAAAVAHCISTWSYVDNELGGLFGILLKSGSDSEAAHRVFLVLRRWAHQREALIAAAEGSLSGDERTLFLVLLREYASIEKQRNQLAHGCFGNCPDNDDLLFVVSIDQHVIWQSNILPKLSAGLAGADPHRGLKEKMLVYRLSDLDRLNTQMQQLWWDLFYFNGFLREPNNPGRAAEFNRLFTSERIQQTASTLP